MRKLAERISAFNRLLFDAAKWLILLIASLMIYEVVARYTLASPTSWAPELATLVFGPFFLLGGPHLLHIGGHVSVDLLSAKAQPGLAKILAAMGYLLAIVFAGILLWFSAPLALQSFEYRETSYSSWNPYIWPAKAVLPVSAALLMLQAVAELIFLASREKRVSP